MSMEAWKPITGYSGYEASSMGRIRSIGSKWQRGRILKQSLGPYFMVRPCINGKAKTIRVHVLVAIAFHNYKPGNRRVNVDHIDNNKLNNNACNLRVISSRENINKERNRNLSKLRSHKSRKKIDRLIDESLDRDLMKVKSGTHKWIYNEKTRANILVRCTRKRK